MVLFSCHSIFKYLKFAIILCIQNNYERENNMYVPLYKKKCVFNIYKFLLYICIYMMKYITIVYKHISSNINI